MADEQAAKRYAQAAFELAQASNSIAAWRSDLQDVAAVLTDSQVANWLADSKVSFEQRAAAVDRILDVQPLARNLAKLLIQRGRSRDARAVATAFARIADVFEGIEDAEIVTAVDIEAGLRERIEQQIASAVGKRIRLSTRVDPALIGGMVVRIGDRQIDGSVRTRLRLLRRELAGAS